MGGGGELEGYKMGRVKKHVNHRLHSHCSCHFPSIQSGTEHDTSQISSVAEGYHPTHLKHMKYVEAGVTVNS